MISDSLDSSRNNWEQDGTIMTTISSTYRIDRNRLESVKNPDIMDDTLQITRQYTGLADSLDSRAKSQGPLESRV